MAGQTKPTAAVLLTAAAARVAAALDQCASSSIFLQPRTFALVKHLGQNALDHRRWPSVSGIL
jgi:hypothetical protein